MFIKRDRNAPPIVSPVIYKIVSTLFYSITFGRSRYIITVILVCDQFSLSTISHQGIVMSFYQHKNLHTKNDITMHWWEMVLSEHWSHASISLTCYSMAAAHHYSIHIDYLILKKVTFEFWTMIWGKILFYHYFHLSNEIYHSVKYR